MVGTPGQHVDCCAPKVHHVTCACDMAHEHEQATHACASKRFPGGPPHQTSTTERRQGGGRREEKGGRVAQRGGQELQHLTAPARRQPPLPCTMYAKPETTMALTKPQQHVDRAGVPCSTPAVAARPETHQRRGAVRCRIPILPPVAHKLPGLIPFQPFQQYTKHTFHGCLGKTGAAGFIATGTRVNSSGDAPSLGR